VYALPTCVCMYVWVYAHACVCMHMYVWVYAHVCVCELRVCTAHLCVHVCV